VEEDTADDLAGPIVCAMAPRLLSKASIVTILIMFRMSISPKMRASPNVRRPPCGSRRRPWGGEITGGCWEDVKRLQT
jgi:hypothetical protein